MQPLTIAAFFCEEIRSERAGFLSLIGMFPPTINLSGPDDADRPSDSKLVLQTYLFVQMNLDPSAVVKSAEVVLVDPEGHETTIVEISCATIEGAQNLARTHGNPVAKIMTYGLLEGFVARFGRFSVSARVDGNTYECTSVTYQPVPKTG